MKISSLNYYADEIMSMDKAGIGSRFITAYLHAVDFPVSRGTVRRWIKENLPGDRTARIAGPKCKLKPQSRS